MGKRGLSILGLSQRWGSFSASEAESGGWGAKVKAEHKVAPFVLAHSAVSSWAGQEGALPPPRCRVEVQGLLPQSQNL